MGKQPGFFFYTGDWLKDTRCLSLEARGAWIDLLCILWESPTKGRITWPLSAYDQYLGTVPRGELKYSAKEILAELTTLHICDKVTEANGEITIISRRMEREENARKSGALRQERYRSRRSNANVTPASSSSLSSSLEIHKNESLCSRPSAGNDLKGKKVSKEKKPKPPPSSEGIQIAQLLSDKISENYSNRTPPTEAQLTEWAYEADRIHRIDGHAWEEIQKLLEWSQQDSFWKANILSIGKFREKWNQLIAKQDALKGTSDGRSSSATSTRVVAPAGKYRDIG